MPWAAGCGCSAIALPRPWEEEIGRKCTGGVRNLKQHLVVRISVCETRHWVCLKPWNSLLAVLLPQTTKAVSGAFSISPGERCPWISHRLLLE